MGVAWGVATGRTNIMFFIVTCDYFYGLEKLNVSMEYKSKKNLSQSGLSKLVAL